MFTLNQSDYEINLSAIFSGSHMLDSKTRAILLISGVNLAKLSLWLRSTEVGVHTPVSRLWSVWREH